MPRNEKLLEIIDLFSRDNRSKNSQFEKLKKRDFLFWFVCAQFPISDIKVHQFSCSNKQRKCGNVFSQKFSSALI